MEPSTPSFGAFPTEDDALSPAVSKDEAIDVGTVALEAMNTRSYEMFSARWSPAMREAIDEEDWLAFRDPFMTKYGEFKSVVEARMTAAETEGFVRFALLAQFERDHVSLVQVYPLDGTEIVGAFFVDPETGEAP